MKFKLSEPDENYTVMRLVSENERWEVGFVQMLFGIRVRAGLVGAGYCCVDYCAGADQIFQLELLATIIQILEALPESASEHEICSMMPPYKVKPIINDPTCWIELQRMAKEARENLGSISSVVRAAS